MVRPPCSDSLTHGYQTAKKKISASSIYFQSMPYQVNMVRPGGGKYMVR